MKNNRPAKHILFACLLLTVCSIGWRAAFSASNYGALPVCEIRGTVSDVKTVKPARVPSPLVESETHISVQIEDRKARYGQNMPCNSLTLSKETRTYKLCSQNALTPGDKIGGTEASATGPASPVGCLFDLVVLSHKN